MARDKQYGPVGAFEDRVLQQDHPLNSPLGNKLARNVGGGGPGTGRTVIGKSGQQATRGSDPGNPPNRPRSGDVMGKG